ncbi:xaa-Pro dipeptidase-like isoform X2 [Cimex lectularius]|uniref:Xaa-Pro dipeptidase n=1 Tax=Cimex lectularius TaxID=79782 RepID=A0A8I6TKJ6_CIMLE|nr:xaa-Pro dipeptidase-like isoform X2 [Cimex lectularius]
MEQEGVTASSAPDVLESASKNKTADFADRTSDKNFSPSGMANDEKEYSTSGTKRESLTASPKDKFSLKSDSSSNFQKSNPSYHSIKAELPLKTTANLPDYMGRASIIPVRSFTSNDSKISVYSKDDYNSLDKTMSMLRQEQEAEMYNWESIINEKLDRDSWTGGFGISPKKKLIQPFQHLTELNGKSSDINIAANHSSLEPYNAFFDEPTTKLTRSSLYSEFSDTISLPETYISESELAEKPELCKTFQERQNERTKRLAVKMLNVIDSLAPTKYVLPTYQTTKYTIPVSMHTFKLNRVRLHERMKSEDPRGFILLKGGEIVNQYNTNSTYTFRQEPFFHWTFGVRHPSFWGGICLRTGSSFLFIPRSSERDETWKRKTPSPNDYKQMYGVSKVMYENEMDSVLTKYNPRKLFLLCGMNSDSGLVLNQPILPVDTTIEIDTKTLYPIMCELRVIKNDYEIELIRQACIVSSDAHKYIMHSMVGMVGYYEYQAQSLFIHYCSYMGGCRTTAYNCICGTDPNAAILHYGQTSMDNNKILKSGDLCIFDMGVSYYGYASDITCTYPINGKFTDDQKVIYNAVLKGRERALEVIRPGIGWDQVHLEVLAAIFTEMRQEALLFGDVDEMIEAELGAVFMPHGIGHLLGIDVHDVGGYNLNTPPKPTRRSLINLRTCRRLTKNMVLTIEPGCYFIEKLLEEADENKKLAKFINFQRISQYGNFRGIRIEDVVLVTEFGCEVLSDVPRRALRKNHLFKKKGKKFEIMIKTTRLKRSASKNGLFS